MKKPPHVADIFTGLEVLDDARVHRSLTLYILDELPQGPPPQRRLRLVTRTKEVYIPSHYAGHHFFRRLCVEVVQRAVEC